MVYRMTLIVLVAAFLLSSTFAVPVEQQATEKPPQAVQTQAAAESQTPQTSQTPTASKSPEETEIVLLPETANPTNEEKSDLDTANTFWGGYYRQPYYGGWGGYGSGWRRGWGGYGGYGYGYGRGFGGWGGRYYWG